MALLNFKKSVTSEAIVSPEVETFLQGYSIEVMPRTAEKIPSFRDLLPLGTRVYICLLYTSPSPRDGLLSRMPSSA